jgi:flagellar biogenesis protein FliO
MELKRNSRYPVPLWTIAFVGMLAGGVLALDGKANANPPKVKTPKVKAIPEVKTIIPVADAKAPKISMTAVSTPVIPKIESVPSAPNTRAQKPRASQRTGKGRRLNLSHQTEKIRFRDTPQEKEAESSGLEMKNMLTLLLLAAVGGIALFFAKRKKGGVLRRGQNMNLIETMRLGGRHHVSLIEVPGRILVVGGNDKGLNLLTELNLPEETETAQPSLMGTPQQPSSAVPLPAGDEKLVRDENDAFFNHLMSRIATAGNERVPAAAETPPRSALRRRLQQYQLDSNLS